MKEQLVHQQSVIMASSTVFSSRKRKLLSGDMLAEFVYSLRDGQSEPEAKGLKKMWHKFKEIVEEADVIDTTTTTLMKKPKVQRRTSYLIYLLLVMTRCLDTFLLWPSGITSSLSTYTLSIDIFTLTR